MTELQEVETYVMALESAGTDITSGYDNWLRLALSLSNLGENGRNLFHRISQFNPDYDRQECDKKFDNCLTTGKGEITLGTFFNACHQAGIKPKVNGHAKGSNPINTPKRKPKPKQEEKWLFNVSDVLNAPPQETLWAFITKGVNNALVASSEAGKSTLLLNLAIAIAKEEEYFLNWPVGALKGRTIYISTEDGIGQLRTRLSAMLKDGVPIPEDSILFILDGRDLPARLEKVLSETPADLIMIDTWGDLVCGKYDAEFTRGTMSEIREVCVKHDGTPLYVHHTNKASENIPDKSSVKGAGDFEQACRVVMMLSIYQDHRWLCCVKGNPFSDDLKNKCYELSYFPDRQQFGRTGNEKPRAEIVRELKTEHLGRPSTEIDFASLLDERLNATSLAKKIMDIYDVSLPTAKRKIAKGVSDGSIAKDPNGLYFAN